MLLMNQWLHLLVKSFRIRLRAMQQAGVKIVSRMQTPTRITARRLAATDSDGTGDQKVGVRDFMALGLSHSLVMWVNQAKRNPFTVRLIALYPSNKTGRFHPTAWTSLFRQSCQFIADLLDAHQ